MLTADVAHRFAEFALDARLEVAAGERLALVGESGSGKTTLLRAIAGLLAPERARIDVAGRAWTDTSAGIAVPPHRRAIGWVAQGYALFPHLSALDNVAFGLRASGVDRAIATARARGAMARLGVAALAGRRPAELSGGQRQRVALARALVLEPEVLLLDEPLAALDLPTRAAVRRELVAALAPLTCRTVIVTHSPIEALVLGDRIAVLEHGRITQTGTRAELLAHPRTTYVAGFLGLNLLPATVVAREDGLLRTRAADGELWVADDPSLPAAAVGDAVSLIVDPRELSLSREAPHGSARTVLAGTVEEIAPEPPDGERLRVAVATRPPLTAEITRAGAAAIGLAPGRTVWVSLKATGVRRVA